MSRRIFFTTLLFSCVPLALIAGGISYQVEFEGLDDSRTLKEMKLASHLTSLKNIVLSYGKVVTVNQLFQSIETRDLV